MDEAARFRSSSAFVIEAIAGETQRSFEEVKGVYETEYARLKAGARITDYLVLIASRRTRAALSGRQ